jgi:hypothetical protein
MQMFLDSLSLNDLLIYIYYHFQNYLILNFMWIRYLHSLKFKNLFLKHLSNT